MRLINLGLLLLLACIGLGCNLRIGEKVSSNNIEGFSVGCLNGINKKVELYKKGQLTSEQINQVSNCLKTALILFKERVRGRKKGEFTPNELRKFIQDLFLQDKTINDALLRQMIRLKTVIIGGPEDKLTETDITRFITFIEVLTKEAVFFQPYIQAFNAPYDKRQLSDKIRLNTIEKDLKKSIGRISIFLNNFSNPYFITDIKALLREINVFFNYRYNHLDQKFAFFSAFKQFIVGGSDTVIQPSEWEDVLLGYVYLISIGVNYSLLKEHSALISPEGTQYISVIFNDLLEFLSLSVENHSGHLIEESDFLRLTSSMKLIKIIPEKIRDESLYKILLIMFGKVFNVDKSRYRVIELTSHQMAKMREMVQLWSGVQAFLNDMFSKKVLKEHLLESNEMSSFFSSKEMLSKGKNIISQMLLLKPLYREGRKIHLSNALFRVDSEHQLIREGVKDLTKTDNATVSSNKENLDVETTDSVDKKKMNYFKSSYSLDYKNLTIYNLYYLIATMLRSGYEKNYPESPGMIQEELKNFFIDFNPIAEDMGWFQKTEGRTLAEGEAEFMAANMLITTTKGFNLDWNEEEYLTSNEITEYIAYAFSFGFSMQELEKIMLRRCGNNNGHSSSHNEDQSEEMNKYAIDCVRVYLIPALKKIMNNMPDFQKVVETMSEEQKKNFAESLIHISYETEQEYQDAIYLNRGNFKNIIMALYFVETTINRYDLNGDLVVQHDEIWAAFPTFEGYLSRVLVHLLCRESGDLGEAVYAYVIQKEALPTSKDLAFYEKWYAIAELSLHDILKSWNMKYWDLFLDRIQLTRVFSTIIKGFLDKKKERISKECPMPSEPVTFDDATTFH